MRHTVGTIVSNAETFPALRGRPLAFLFSYLRRHPAGHLTVLLAVLVAVTCSVSTQYGMKYLIDIVATGRDSAGGKVWVAFALLCGLVAADNLSWRVGGFAAHRSFVAGWRIPARGMCCHPPSPCCCRSPSSGRSTLPSPEH
jgi:hypothetical protein